MRVKLLTIGVSLLLICIMLVVWANAALLNIAQKKGQSHSNLAPYIKPVPTSQNNSGDSDFLVQIAKNDAKNRFNLKEEDLKTQEVIDTQFGDSSLGCSEPGKDYSQVVTAGWVIKLQAGQNTYEYHSDKFSRVVFCQ